MSTETSPGLELARKRWTAGTDIRTARRAEQIVRDWPILTAEQRAVIREILVPVTEERGAA
jgi:hypothetical protein